ncbi:DUF3231 family protein [Evansella tamaricis]|uniref:DUF3231 family protein n=1 Tax=Evansella tamaricis TaxID=2069301 RepID=A0ABS6JIJ5_9BACI|nr:DUF3231 family protein [Evansella tamaricis]MBU9713466.1 DUF3231 family protein [Evansella tamaricis]
MSMKNPISVSEVGTLWLMYQQKTLILRVLEYFLEKSDDQQAKNIMGGLWQNLDFYVKEIESLFEKEGITVPVGFTKGDVNLESPKLFDNGFDIMFVRVLKELSLGMYTINLNMAYRKDIISLYESLTTMSNSVYKIATTYLLDRGILVTPPNVPPPKGNDYIERKNYLNGFHPFGQPRSLSDIEVGILHHGIETNNIGFQLISGFAQCAEDKSIRKYFIKGKELAKKQIKIFEEILQKNDTPLSVTSGGNVTSSQMAPFSEKLMMYLVYLLNGFGLVGSSFGTIFSLRNDLSMKSALIAKDIFVYANDGVEIMIKKGWLEEPPQTPDIR